MTPNIARLESKHNVRGLCKALHPAAAHHEARKALVRVGAPAVDSLISALRSEHGHVRAAAAKALGEIGDKRAVDGLLAAIEDRDGITRAMIIMALGKLADPRATEDICHQFEIYSEAAEFRRYGYDMRNGRVYDVRYRWNSSPNAPMPDTDPDLFIRNASTAPTLRRWHDSRARWSDSLTRALYITEQPDQVSTVAEWISCAAADALAAFGRPAIETLAISHGLTGDVPGTEARVALLARIGAPVVEPLIARLGHEQDAWLAVRALGRMGAPSVEPLIAVLQEENLASGRSAAARALGLTGDQRAVEPLIAALDDADPRVPTAAGWALHELRWQPRDNRQRAIQAIATEDWDDPALRDPEAIALLIAAIDSSSFPDDRWISALAKVGRRAVKDLIAALQHRNSNVCSAAARALGQIGDRRAVEPLIAILLGTGRGLRSDSAAALGKIGDQRAVEPLITALAQPSYFDVQFANVVSKALGSIGDARAVEPLRVALAKATHAAREHSSGDPDWDGHVQRAEKTLLEYTHDISEALIRLGSHPPSDEDR